MTYDLSLRAKSFFLLGSSLLVLTVMVSIAFQAVVQDQFRDLEDRHVQDNVKRAVNYIESTRQTLYSKLLHWANCDDSYKFISDLNETYIESNISYDALSVLGIHYMAFVDRSGTVVFDALTDDDSASL